MKGFLQRWRSFISSGIWINEKLFFYPKLKRYLLSQPLSSPIIFDIGANRGQSIKFFESIFSNPTIYAFEPSQAVFTELLKKHSKSNVHLHNFGLSDCDESKIFYECVFDEVSSLEKPNIDSEYFRFKCRVLLTNPSNMLRERIISVKKLDDIVYELGVRKIDLCKIDVEGHELKVLQGAENMLKKKLIDYVQLEVHDDGQYAVGFSEIDRFLKSFDYHLAISLKHGFGSFFDVVYVHNGSSATRKMSSSNRFELFRNHQLYMPNDYQPCLKH